MISAAIWRIGWSVTISSGKNHSLSERNFDNSSPWAPRSFTYVLVAVVNFYKKCANKTVNYKKLITNNELENKKIPKKKVTVDEIFNYYLRNSALDKAQSTITKQKSVYKNHIKEVFGDTNVEELFWIIVENIEFIKCFS